MSVWSEIYFLMRETKSGFINQNRIHFQIGTTFSLALYNCKNWNIWWYWHLYKGVGKNKKKRVYAYPKPQNPESFGEKTIMIYSIY